MKRAKIRVEVRPQPHMRPLGEAPQGEKGGRGINIRLNVKCTYSVYCEFDDVPEKIAKQLLEMDEVKEGTDVYDWLSDNIKEGDAYEWEFDVCNVEEREGG